MPDLPSQPRDGFDLDRFVAAQATTFDAACAELRAGRKRSHWIWFIFPQMRGLGFSATAQHYGITSLDEARAYLAHPVLGARLDACTKLVLAIEGRTLHEIFGSPDDLKFRSSMTLFALASPEDRVFEEALVKFCDGRRDPATLRLLGLTPSGS